MSQKLKPGLTSSRGTFGFMDSISSIERLAASKSSLFKDFPSTTASFSSGASHQQIVDNQTSAYYQLLRANYQAQ